jgi:pyruvate dehydrogenase E1 component alpha subunit
VLIEAKTYRVDPFSTNDRVTGYQPEDEIKRWMAKDPINRFKEQIRLLGIAEEEEIISLEEKAGHDAFEAIEFGQSTDYPDVESLYDGLLA